jgi:hypothetical protein
MLVKAYREFEDRVGTTSAKQGATRPGRRHRYVS